MGAFLSGVSSVLQKVGPIVQGVGEIIGGVQANRAAQFNASVSKANAQAIRQSAEFDIGRQRREAKRLKSKQIAGYAKAGVRLEGSPLEVLLSSASEAELDAMIIDYNARVGIAQAGAQARQYRRIGKTALWQGVFGGTKTLLSSDVFKLKED